MLELFYDGENLTINIKEAFQPLVEIASFVNGGDGGSRTHVQNETSQTSTSVGPYFSRTVQERVEA